MIQQILFVLLSAVSIYFFTKKVMSIRRNILLGKDEQLNDQPKLRWRNMMIFALGQKKMFKNPLVAVLHLFVYVGFVIINIEILEIFLDGILGTHRLFEEMPFYKELISSFEFLAILVIVGCVVFLVRRNFIKVNRFTKPELKGFPFRDANYILITEIVLMLLFLIMNSTDIIRHQAMFTNGNCELIIKTYGFFSTKIYFAFFENFSYQTLKTISRTCWWLHIAGIFAFLNYLPYSKHLHIILAFPNSFFARLNNIGQMENMPLIQKEVVLSFQPERAAEFPGDDAPLKFGAKDVKDLSWKSLMDAYSCSECGRCTAACPANQTGKKLSPRKIMMDTRDRLEEVGNNIDKHGMDFTDNKSLLGDYISVEELRACTTCNACVEQCPILISPLHIISELRRSLVMEDSNVPNEWAMMFGNLENNQSPWKFSNEDRANWRND
jgi:formate hydrogenlyase subunit 6/NADH:ubiquinone oxidoreductase subunit I